jgi:glyoxylase-like metal-dependent hydrolase (beta-lactamase superfamily II)/rhodanese-related sulfurtransferase
MRHVITIETPALGDRSYIVHDGAVGVVIDPQRDIDRFLGAVDDAGVDITHVAETHLHEDYASGALALARTLGATYVHAAAEDLEFDHCGVRDGDTLSIGSLTLEARHTPGHTPHHLTYVVHAADQEPAAFTGGFLLFGTVGRTDLAGPDLTEPLARAQFRSAHALAAAFPDGTEIHPTHGFGSFCAAVKSDGDSDGTLGTERQVNVALTTDDEDEFVRALLSSLMPHPSYYARTGLLNRAGPVPVDLSPTTTLSVDEIARRVGAGEWVVDIRDREAFARDHLAGTIGIELADPFATYLGWLIPWGTPLTLLADESDQVLEAQRQLVRVGIDRPNGAGVGGPSTWATGEQQHRHYPVVDFEAVARERSPDVVVVDVRRDDEWAAGHLDGARHLPLHELITGIDRLPRAHFWVHCASGYRASIAASLLDRAGRTVTLIDDDYEHAAPAGNAIVSDE